MPELPEVETVCRSLRGPLTGHTVTGVTINWERTVDPHDPIEFSKNLAGKRIERVFRRAKLIVFRLSDASVMTTHLRMTGKLLYVENGTCGSNEPAKHLRLAIQLDNGGRLAFYDARKFGRIRMYSARDWESLSASFGPEPLDPEFTSRHFYERLQATRRQIKPLLLDQTFLAGVGNIYADEALFRARIHPLTISSSISRRKSTDLHSAVVETLMIALGNQGTTLRDYRSGLGEEGSNQSSLLVYGAKPGTPCPRCGTTLKRLVIGQRGSTICPRCQRLR